MSDVETFSAHRPLLFSIAYRMLGSVADAEDAVQETFLRWHATPPNDVRSPKAYLSTVITRLCIDEMRSARAQRERYIGPWLPEPLVTEETSDVDEHLALADSVSMAFLVLLESLSPVERAVFLLHDVFEYPYDEIARMVDKSEGNCRQLAHRARERVATGRQRFEAPPEQVERAVERFVRASATGDVDALVAMLTEDATVWSDGGGKVAAALNPIVGAAKVARFFAGVARQMPSTFEYRLATVNGGPGMIGYIAGRPYMAVSLDFAGEKLRAARIVNNPDKLRHVPSLSAAG